MNEVELHTNNTWAVSKIKKSQNEESLEQAPQITLEKGGVPYKAVSFEELRMSTKVWG